MSAGRYIVVVLSHGDDSGDGEMSIKGARVSAIHCFTEKAAKSICVWLNAHDGVQIAKHFYDGDDNG